MAMERGFTDACVALCMDETPKPKVATTCRSAAIEMPRPTVRKWCEHGYNVAFEKTVKDLKPHFAQQRALAEQSFRIEEELSSATVETKSETIETKPAEVVEEREVRKLIAKIPITLDDTEVHLEIYEGENAEDVVLKFCQENVADAVSDCIREILPSVLERLES
jgi:hypothetical protein